MATAGLERAMKAGATALFVTIDTAVAGLRERDFRNGTKELLTRNPWTMLPFVHQFLLRPRWLAGFIGDGGLMNFPNVVLKDGPMSYADVGAALEQSTVCWADLRWIREVWKGPIVIKGLHDRRRCPPRRGRGRPGRRRLQSRRTPARLRLPDAARAARSRRGGERPV